MKTIMMLAPLALLGACATTGTKSATAEERAQCEAMAQQMGTQSTHDHGQMKGGVPNTMNLTHERCRQILAQQ